MTDFDDPRRFGQIGKDMTVQVGALTLADRFSPATSRDVSTLLARVNNKRRAARHQKAATARQAVKGARRSNGEAHQKPATYVIGIEGSPFVKIGYTGGSPEARVRQLQTGLPMQLSLLWSSFGDYEDDLHDRFVDYRVRGEWFDLTPLGDPVEVVKVAVAEINAPFLA